MRICVLFALLLASGPAFADAAVGDCKPNDSGGCGSDHTFHYCPADMSIVPTPDMERPRDLTMPPDARRERRRKQEAHGRGLVLLSGLSSLAIVLLRRRYKTSRPTPAENALAASATRKDS
ncbi:MAG TPA: hypothetical protein VGL86_22455 [Polyangia bacterium]|jgi:hypothetical protein